MRLIPRRKSIGKLKGSVVFIVVRGRGCIKLKVIDTICITLETFCMNFEPLSVGKWKVKVAETWSWFDILAYCILSNLQLICKIVAHFWRKENWRTSLVFVNYWTHRRGRVFPDLCTSNWPYMTLGYWHNSPKYSWQFL